MNHDQAYFTELQINNFIERGFDIIVRQNNEHTGLCGPRIYYGMTHEVRAWPSVRYIPTGIFLEHLGTDTTIREPRKRPRKQRGSVLQRKVSPDVDRRRLDN